MCEQRAHDLIYREKRESNPETFKTHTKQLLFLFLLRLVRTSNRRSLAVIRGETELPGHFRPGNRELAAGVHGFVFAAGRDRDRPSREERRKKNVRDNYASMKKELRQQRKTQEISVGDQNKRERKKRARCKQATTVDRTHEQGPVQFVSWQEL